MSGQPVKALWVGPPKKNYFPLEMGFIKKEKLIFAKNIVTWI